jgi:hypothetical protein
MQCSSRLDLLAPDKSLFTACGVNGTPEFRICCNRKAALVVSHALPASHSAEDRAYGS